MNMSPNAPTTPTSVDIESSKEAPVPTLFVFNAEKSTYVTQKCDNKWKRIVRDELIDKGDHVQTNTGETFSVNKRVHEFDNLGVENVLVATKRSKLSLVHNLSS